MKKMFIMMALCLPMVMLSSCSKDDDESNSSIVGTWALCGEACETTIEDTGYKPYIVFYADGVEYGYGQNVSTSEFYVEDMNTYTYDASTGVFTMDNDALGIIKIKGNNMYVVDEEYGEFLYMTRVNPLLTREKIEELYPKQGGSRK